MKTPKITRRTLLAGAGAGLAGLAGCGRSKFLRYDGPEVTRVLVFKGTRRMYLMHHESVLAAHAIDLGFAPVGHKVQEGDGKTPEGDYVIDRKNPDSSFHLSLGISYPNAQDIEVAQALGVKPGGDIFIHGGPRRQDRKGRDWTWGCISVTDPEIEMVYAMVPVGTPITLTA